MPVMRALSALVLFASLASSAACNMGPGEPSSQAPSAPAKTAAVTPTPTPTTAPAALALGAPITVTETVKLSDVAKNPGAFKGKPIATTGIVTAVCQERGCWMAIKDDGGGTATVRMHGHSFFVPRSSAGKKARVQANVVLVKDGMECDDMNAQGAELELDATGVELL